MTPDASFSFTSHSGVSQCFFCNRTTLAPHRAPVPIALADSYSGPVVARSATTIPCSAVPANSLSVASCSCRSLTHPSLLWHHCLPLLASPSDGTPQYRLRSPCVRRPTPPLPALPCIPCDEGQQRAAPHSSFPHTIIPLQTLHIDI
ncbi:unnamed protein product [Closterium sp. NIES-54]